MMVGGTGFGSGSAEDFSVECQQTSLEAVGIGSVFHDRLISAGLDLETLQMAAVDRQSLYSLLKEAGISRPGDRVRIANSVLRKSLSPPNLLHAVAPGAVVGASAYSLRLLNEGAEGGCCVPRECVR